MRAHPAYANIASTLALVVALGSGGAYAAGLAKDSVSSKQIKNGAVKAVDLAEGAVTADQLANGSVTAAKLAPGAVPSAQLSDGSVTSAKLAAGAVTGPKLGADSVTGAAVASDTLTGADISESSLGSVPNASQSGLATRASNTAAAVVTSNGTLQPSQSYQVSSAVRATTGLYVVTFSRDITTCAYVAGVGKAFGGESSPPFATSATATYGGTSNSVTVLVMNGTTSTDAPFQLLVIC